MGFRFRKTVRLGGLVRLNFSGSGVSLGLGPRGANVNISRRGVRQTVGLPGTGLSYQSFKKWPDPPPPSTSAQTQLTSSPPPAPAQTFPQSTGFLKFLGAIALVVFLVSVLGLWKGVPSPPAVTVMPAAPATPAAAPKAPGPATAPAANPAVATPPTPPPANTAPLTLEEVREAQTWLKAFLLDPGPLDGLPGPQTAAAVSKYQTARQRPVTGVVDRPLLEALRRDTGGSIR